MSDFDQAAMAAGPEGGVPNLEPKRIKVFGVMHLVFGGLGLLQVIFSLVMIPFQGKMMELSSAGGSEEMAEMQMEVVKKLMPATWIGLMISLIVAILILRAGLGLVKQKSGAVQASNLYCWVSLGAKLVTLVMFFAFVLPVYDTMFEEIVDEAAGGAKEMLAFMRISAAAAGILGPIVMSVYPIVALVMLNKPDVKDYFARLGR